MALDAQATRGPQGELGTASPAAGLGWNLGSGAGLADLAGTEREEADAWRWPQAVDTVDAMFNDAQVVSLTSAIMLPAQFADVRLNPNGMSDADAAMLAADLDIPLVGADEPPVSAGRRRDSFNHRKHFGRALSALGYGHAAFEIVGEIRDGRWRLKNLAPRPSWSITRFLVDGQGRLKKLETLGRTKPITLESSRVALWTWGGEVGDPRGKSILRSLYRPWMLKDRGMRIDMIGHERNAMGIPIGWLPEGGTPADRDELLELLANVAAGEDTALIVPHGGDIKFRGVEGSTSKPIESVKFMNEEMARALLGMIVNLGQTQTGSRAVGDNFMDLLGLFHRVVLNWYCDLLTEQVVEPWVNFNYGMDAPAARVVWEEVEEERAQEEGVPEFTSEGQEVPAEGTALSRRRAPLQRTAFASILPDRPLARDPFPHEVKSGANFKAIEADHVASVNSLVQELAAIREELGEVAASTIAALGAEYAASPERIVLAEEAVTSAVIQAREGVDLGRLTAAVEAAHAQGIAQVVSEAAGQGVETAAVVQSYSEAAGEARDLVSRTSRQVIESTLSAARVGGPDAAVVADAARERIAALATSTLEGFASSAISRAELTGRTAQIEQTSPAAIYASELLDGNTCGPCSEIDGTEYSSVDEAKEKYPSGGYLFCEGGDRCRGTLVVVYETEGQEV